MPLDRPSFPWKIWWSLPCTSQPAIRSLLISYLGDVLSEPSDWVSPAIVSENASVTYCLGEELISQCLPCPHRRGLQD
jgi:hypothetical protein